jgi:DNA-binding transcriptional ArsR family regulator
MAPTLNKKISELCKALGHPKRVQIMRYLLKQKEGCLCGELVDLFDCRQSTVSQHLKILREANLIAGTAEGTSRCYCVNQEALKNLKAMFNLM